MRIVQGADHNLDAMYLDRTGTITRVEEVDEFPFTVDFGNSETSSFARDELEITAESGVAFDDFRSTALNAMYKRIGEGKMVATEKVDKKWCNVVKTSET